MTQSDSTHNPTHGVHNHAGIVDESLPDIASELVANGSIELSIGDDRQIHEASQLLPYGMSVFVPSPPKRDLMSNLQHVQALFEAGFEPVPHIAARKIESRAELEKFLARASGDFGVHRVLVIGGDAREPRGSYKDGAAVLRDGILAEQGINEVVLPGYPEGHRKISQEVLMADLEEKLALATEQGLCSEIVTQFCFAPSRIVEYCSILGRRLPEIPVYVGLAGPTSTARLIRYANYCGVSASLRALSTLGVKVANLLTHTDPTEQLQIIAHHCATHPANNIIGIHLFSFGGFSGSAQWMHDVIGAAVRGEQASR